MNNKKVGCLTWHDVYNFGSELQAYALQETLKNLGYSSEFISYKKESSLFSKMYRYFCEFRALVTPIDKRCHGEAFIRFRHDFLKCSKKKYNSKNIVTANKAYSVFICGSDQIWAPNVYDPTYFLSFTDKKKVSYAASIGLNEIPNELIPQYSKYLFDFHSISVRETEGKELLKKCCNIDSVVMPDPTTLLNGDQWKHISILPKTTKPYVFCYFLNKNHGYKEMVMKMAKQGIDIIGISASSGDAYWMQLVNSAGPREFLGYIEKADMVFTDSFHGSIFSLVFQKPLWIFERFKAIDPLCQNSRIYQLTRDLSITDRILTQNTNNDTPIDYNTVQMKLNEYIVKGRAFLKRSLED